MHADALLGSALARQIRKKTYFLFLLLLIFYPGMWNMFFSGNLPSFLGFEPTITLDGTSATLRMGKFLFPLIQYRLISSLFKADWLLLHLRADQQRVYRIDS